MQLQKIMMALILGLFGTLPTLLFAGSAEEQMVKFLNNLTTFKAGFEQSVLDSQHRSATRTQGTFYLKKPGRFRWDYSEPDAQQIIADGDNVWLLEPDLKQVSVQGQKSALEGTPAMLLISGDPVDKHFEIIDIGKSKGLYWVELIPRSVESQFVRILLAFHREQLKRMEMTDQFGQISRFQFHDIVLNSKLDDKLFIYERPLDYDLYER